jgi:tRNA pseudouridine synthase 10
MIKSLAGKTIEQQTPKRVLSRRADLTRKRKIHSISAAPLEGGKLTLEILAEAGTYIKELINSDSGRTSPSVSGLLKCNAVCEALDVVEIRDYFLQTVLHSVSD